MDERASSMLAGVAGGLAMGIAMSAGRRDGILHKALARDSGGLLGKIGGTRRRFERRDRIAAEIANHLAASATFGHGYGYLRRALPAAAGIPLGLGYGALLFAVNNAGLARALGTAEGEFAAPRWQTAERLGVHLLYGAVTAAITEYLLSRHRR